MQRDEDFVTWGRWQEAHESNLRRLDKLERGLGELSGAEQVHETLEARITNLEDTAKAEESGKLSRKDRLWVIALAVTSGVVFPILVSAVYTLFHLRKAF